MSLEEDLLLIPPYTKEDFLKEKAYLEKQFKLKYGLDPDQIDEAVRVHRFGCADALSEDWLSMMAFKPYLDL